MRAEGAGHWAAQGIHCIDTGLQRPGFDAAWLVVEQGRAAFIDCGTSHALPHMLKALDVAGLTPADVDWLILTHIHLDHAGGAGALLRALPRAKVAVHPRGLAHLVDPSRLVASATAVYGQAGMDRHYGRIEPVPADRVAAIGDGQAIDLAGRGLLCEHTPGHAIHHLCVWDGRTRSWFTGDTFGIAYRELQGPRGRFVIPSSSPTQFDPAQLVHSIRRLMLRRPLAMHLTHYGTLGEPAAIAPDLVAQVEDIARMARGQAGAADREEALFAALSDYWAARARAAGLDVAQAAQALAIDIRLNAQGLVSWLERTAR